MARSCFVSSPIRKIIKRSKFNREQACRISISDAPKEVPAKANVTHYRSLTDMVCVIEDWEVARSLKTSGETMVG